MQAFTALGNVRFAASLRDHAGDSFSISLNKRFGYGNELLQTQRPLVKVGKHEQDRGMAYIFLGSDHIRCQGALAWCVKDKECLVHCLLEGDDALVHCAHIVSPSVTQEQPQERSYHSSENQWRRLEWGWSGRWTAPESELRRRLT